MREAGGAPTTRTRGIRGARPRADPARTRRCAAGCRWPTPRCAATAREPGSRPARAREVATPFGGGPDLAALAERGGGVLERADRLLRGVQLADLGPAQEGEHAGDDEHP